MAHLEQDINENEYPIIPKPFYYLVFRYLIEESDGAMIVIFDFN